MEVNEGMLDHNILCNIVPCAIYVALLYVKVGMSGLPFFCLLVRMFIHCNLVLLIFYTFRLSDNICTLIVCFHVYTTNIVSLMNKLVFHVYIHSSCLHPLFQNFSGHDMQ